MRVCLYTIKHTGTHFMARHLERMGLGQAIFDGAHQSVFAHEPVEPLYYHIHAAEQFDSLKVIGRDHVTVTTMRDPRQVYLSMGRRRSRVQPFYIELDITAAYAHWAKFVHRYDPIIVRVDADNMVQQIENLAAELGFPDYRYAEVDRNHMDGEDFPTIIPPHIIELARQHGYTS